MRANTKDDKVTTLEIIPYVVVAVIKLDGGAKQKAIIEVAEPLVREVFSSTFGPSDRTVMCWGPSGRGVGFGEIEAPDGYQGITWEAWQGKISTAIMIAVKQGYLERTYQNGIIEVTTKGRELVQELL